MQFLCLGFLDTGAFDALPATQRDAVMARCMSQCIPFRETGMVVAEDGLEDASLAKSIRPGEEGPAVSDGPFRPGQPQIGAYFIVEAATIAEALEVASLHPAARLGAEFGFGIEVRQIQ